MIIAVDPRYFRPAEVETLLGDRLKRTKNWAGNRNHPQRDGAEMVANDLEAAKDSR